MSEKRPSRPGKYHPMVGNPLGKPVGSSRGRLALVKSLIRVQKPPLAKTPSEPVPPGTRVAEVISASMPKLLGLSEKSAAGKKVMGAVQQALLASVSTKGMTEAKAGSVISKVESPVTQVQTIVVPGQILANVGLQTPKSQLSSSNLVSQVQAALLPV